MAILGTSRLMTTGVSAGITPSATLVTGPISSKLLLDLGADRLEIGLGPTPHAALAALRDDLIALTEVKEAA
ncbi:MAG: hypothetical protein ACR2K4_00465 [Candidatus Limnocylindria bacterium]